jgi:plastocyanin
MPRSRLALTLALTLTACSGSSPSTPAAAAPDAGQLVVAGQNGMPRFVTPGAAAGQEDQVAVGAGGTVTWRFASTGFNVISGGSPDGGAPDGGCIPDGVFCSPNDQSCDGGVPPQAAGSFYQRTFQTVGDYPYFSQPGCVQGMTGVVHVLETPPPDAGVDGGADGGP